MSWIIYKHVNKKNGKVYIGQSKYTWSSINDRWQNGRGYGPKTRFGMAIEKYGWDNFEHELVESDIRSSESANEREIYWIKYYNSYAEGYNCTSGGKNISKELCFKLRIYCLETNQEYESITEASQKLNIGYHLITRQLTTGHYYEKDKLHFCLASEKRSFSPKNYIPNRSYESVKRNIICVETLEIFDSITDCSKATGISTQNLSQNCCKNHRTAKGKHYAYLEEFDENWIPAESYDSSRRKEVSSLKKEIYCYETNTFYKSATECANILNIPLRSVTRCAKKDSDLIKTHGYSFCYKEDYYEGWKPRTKKKTTYIITDTIRAKKRNNAKCKRVFCVETKEIFSSLNDAERKTGISSNSISSVCKKKKYHNSAGGYHWKYVD